jgi:hypothetical protein
MSLVYLNLPIRSDAFSAFVTPAREAQSPPRKFARLEGEAGTGAGRSRLTERAKGPQRVTLSLRNDGMPGSIQPRPI